VNRQQLPEQQAFTYYDKEKGIPRRSSAQYGQGSYPAVSPPTNAQKRQQATSDDNAFRMPASQLRHRPIGNMYVIPLTDGTEMHVTERELDSLPDEYQDAAQLITPQLPSGTPKPKRQPNPRRPAPSDGGVIYAPPALKLDIDEPQPRRKRRTVKHPYLYLGVGMLAMLALCAALSSFITWWNTWQDDVHYGRPRTYQVDAVVGHNSDSSANPSHYIFLNLNRHVEVIEIPAGDPSKMKVYIGPILCGDNDDLTAVTGYFKDVNGDGKPDMIIKIHDTTIVFINTGDSFRPLKPGEQVNI
jgi:hypothetical protein